jgi:hypothetical protein
VASQIGIQRMIDESWRHWIAENILQDVSVATLTEVMVDAGHDRDEVAREIQKAIDSPYLQGATRIKARLLKREWGYHVRRKLRRMHPSFGQIERRHRLPREEFFLNYYLCNRPVLITGMIDSWPALTKWNMDYLRMTYGDRTIQVQSERTPSRRYEIERKYRMMRFDEFIAAIDGGPSNELYMTANDNNFNQQALEELWQDIVQIPEYLNGNVAGGMIWIGPASTVTPMHHDLTNNFMAQVIGRKLVRLVPLCDMPIAYNDYHVYSQVDLGNIDYNRFPNMKNAEIIEVVIVPGDLLFIPVGWFHYVKALDASITFTFINFLLDNDFYSFHVSNKDV